MRWLMLIVPVAIIGVYLTITTIRRRRSGQDAGFFPTSPFGWVVLVVAALALVALVVWIALAP